MYMPSFLGFGRGSSSESSFSQAIRMHPGKLLALGGVLSLLIGLEALGYIRDTMRPSSVRWLFKSGSST